MIQLLAVPRVTDRPKIDTDLFGQGFFHFVLDDEDCDRKTQLQMNTVGSARVPNNSRARKRACPGRVRFPDNLKLWASQKQDSPCLTRGASGHLSCRTSCGTPTHRMGRCNLTRRARRQRGGDVGRIAADANKPTARGSTTIALCAPMDTAATAMIAVSSSSPSSVTTLGGTKHNLKLKHQSSERCTGFARTCRSRRSDRR